MREVISVHVGQAGVQIGNACCEFSAILGTLLLVSSCKHYDSKGELYTLEHGLSVRVLVCSFVTTANASLTCSPTAVFKKAP